MVCLICLSRSSVVGVLSTTYSNVNIRNKTFLCTVTTIEMRECEHHMFSVTYANLYESTSFIISPSNKLSNDDILFAYVAITKGFN